MLMPDITITASDGGSFGAYLASPASGTGAGLVVIQEIFGVNQVMRDLCDGYAAQGYFAVCPDLFWRQEPGVQLTDRSQEEWDKAFALMNGFLPNFEQGVGDLIATLDHVRGIDGCSGKAGAVGYCLGGSLAYGMACFSDSDACVGYYPVQIENSLENASKISHPLMIHMAENDGFCPPEAQAKINDALGGNALVTINTCAGVDHAFARIGGQNYDQAAADLANSRTSEFFAANLA
jgi:carboxymethylenebutenolidase